mmetsp:Transcript_89055/g.238458  ORF Transcript_89055/g.238458 Transcript_89055/m.238458 type:complete len:347 (-) Transcript_89055:254-1294(-)
MALTAPAAMPWGQGGCWSSAGGATLLQDDPRANSWLMAEPVHQPQPASTKNISTHDPPRIAPGRYSRTRCCASQRCMRPGTWLHRTPSISTHALRSHAVGGSCTIIIRLPVAKLTSNSCVPASSYRHRNTSTTSPANFDISANTHAAAPVVHEASSTPEMGLCCQSKTLPPETLRRKAAVDDIGSNSEIRIFAVILSGEHLWNLRPSASASHLAAVIGRLWCTRYRATRPTHDFLRPSQPPRSSDGELQSNSQAVSTSEAARRPRAKSRSHSPEKVIVSSGTLYSGHLGTTSQIHEFLVVGKAVLAQHLPAPYRPEESSTQNSVTPQSQGKFHCSPLTNSNLSAQP